MSKFPGIYIERERERETDKRTDSQTNRQTIKMNSCLNTNNISQYGNMLYHTSHK